MCAGENPNAPEGSAVQRGFYAVNSSVAAVEIAKENPADRVLCLGCPNGALCKANGLNITSILSAPGFWRSNNSSKLFHRCLFEGSDCLGSGCREGHAGVVCALCDNGFARMEGELAPCSLCPKGTGAGNDSTESLAGLLTLCFSIFFVCFVYMLSRSDGEYEKKMNKNNDNDNGDDGDDATSNVIALVESNITDKITGTITDISGDTSGSMEEADAERQQTVRKKAGKKGKDQIYSNQMSKHLVGHLKILAGWIQIMTSLTTTFSVPWVSLCFATSDMFTNQTKS